MTSSCPFDCVVSFVLVIESWAKRFESNMKGLAWLASASEVKRSSDLCVDPAVQSPMAVDERDPHWHDASMRQGVRGELSAFGPWFCPSQRLNFFQRQAWGQKFWIWPRLSAMFL